MARRGMPYTPPINYAKVDPARAKRIADAYERMDHDPHHPLTHAAYDAMVRETMDQYLAAKRAGFRAEFWPKDDEDPYGPSPRLAIEDINRNHHMFVYPTRLGYGAGGIKPEDVADNPLLQDSGERWNGHPVTVNDIFRATHDYFGHAKEGVGFRHDGEENAWRAHAAMYSPLARIAMTNETRGQNSWVNFGPHGEHNQTARGEDTIFAPQKIGHLPPWAVHEGAEDFMPPEDRARVEAAYGLLPRRRRRDGGQIAPQIAPSDLFDMSLLHETPNVPQFDLPRYEPPRGAPARVADLIANKAVREKMKERIHRGRLVGSIWYNAEPLRREFVAAHGEDTGNRIFRRYMDYVAATSPQSEIGVNARNASYYLHRELTGQGMPTGEKVFEGGTKKLPSPYGHKAQDLHIRNARRLFEEGGWDPLLNPKPRSFVENLVGNQQPGTIDTHAMKLPAMLSEDPRFLLTSWRPDTDTATKQKTPARNLQAEVESGATPMSEALRRAAYWENKPNKTEYGAMERYYQGLGHEMGLSTGQTQASAWVGGGDLTGLKSVPNMPFMTALNDRVMRTAQARNMDPRDVTRQFVTGKAPLLARGGRARRAEGGGADDPEFIDNPLPNDAWAWAQLRGGKTQRESAVKMDAINAAHRAATETTVPIDSLTGVEHQLGRRALASPSTELPVVERLGGKHWLIDGNHRVNDAHRKGAKDVRVRLADVDAELARRGRAEGGGLLAGLSDKPPPTPTAPAAVEHQPSLLDTASNLATLDQHGPPGASAITPAHLLTTTLGGGGRQPPFARGGFPRASKPQLFHSNLGHRHHLHVGPIHSAVHGRTDHLPMHVPSGSYVLPADVVSAHGEGNTVAGFKVMRRLFGGAPYGGGNGPYGQGAGPYGEALQNSRGGPAPRATGGGIAVGFRPIKNPSPRALAALVDRSKDNWARGLYDGRDTHWWDARHAIHTDAARALGIPVDDGGGIVGGGRLDATRDEASGELSIDSDRRGGVPDAVVTPYRRPGLAAGGFDSRGGRAQDGDSDEGVPIVAAGGEFVLSPHQVRAVGGGDADLGTQVLDEFVKRSRARNIKTLQRLPGPAKD
jgi:hypothetical protein